jgi:hypothetical protein
MINTYSEIEYHFCNLQSLKAMIESVQKNPNY